MTHLAPEECGRAGSNEVDGKQVPAKHFGVVLDPKDWKALAGRLEAAGVEFIIEPGIRFQGETGEQGTFFFLDPGRQCAGIQIF